MFRRIGFRRLLPAIHVILYIVLVLVSYPESSRSYLGSGPPLLRLASFGQEGSGIPPFNPERIDRPTPTAMKAAVAVNMPAIFASVPLFTLAHTIKQEFWALLAASLSVGIQWYLVGLWADRQLGFVPRPRSSRSHLYSVLRWVLLAACVLLFGGALFLSMWVLLVTRLGESDNLWILGGGLFWSIFLFLVTTLNILRARNDAVAPQREPLKADP